MQTKQKERESVTFDMGVDQSAWRGTRKLGSLLGAEEDVARRIQLANVSFGKLEALWKHRSYVA